MTVYAITGASRGLGLGYTKGLLEQSADNLVIALVRDPAGAKELQGLTAQYSNRLVIVKHDLTEQSAEVSRTLLLARAFAGYTGKAPWTESAIHLRAGCGERS